MKMNYQLKSSRRKSGLKKYYIAILIIVVISINFFKVDFVRNSVGYLTIPILKVVNIVTEPVSFIGTYFKSKQDLEKEIKRLSTEITLLKNKNLKATLLQEENLILREILDNREDDENVIIADVIKRPPSSVYDTLLIDAGAKHGLEVGHLVFSFDTFIGTVVSVSKNTSIVKLVSAPKEILSVYIAGEIPAEARGEGGGRFAVTLPKDIEVEVGDLVTIDNNKAPVIGVVSAIDSNEASTFQTLYFNFQFLLSDIKIVEITHGLVTTSKEL